MSHRRPFTNGDLFRAVGVYLAVGAVLLYFGIAWGWLAIVIGTIGMAMLVAPTAVGLFVRLEQARPGNGKPAPVAPAPTQPEISVAEGYDALAVMWDPLDKVQAQAFRDMAAQQRAWVAEEAPEEPRESQEVSAEPSALKHRPELAKDVSEPPTAVQLHLRAKPDTIITVDPADDNAHLMFNTWLTRAERYYLKLLLALDPHVSGPTRRGAEEIARVRKIALLRWNQESQAPINFELSSEIDVLCPECDEAGAIRHAGNNVAYTPPRGHEVDRDGMLVHFETAIEPARPLRGSDCPVCSGVGSIQMPGRQSVTCLGCGGGAS